MAGGQSEKGAKAPAPTTVFTAEFARAVQAPGQSVEATVEATTVEATTAGSSSSSSGLWVVGFQLVCVEKVDLALLDVKAKEYSHGGGGPGAPAKARKKVERVLGCSEKVSLPLIIPQGAEEGAGGSPLPSSTQRFSVCMEVPEAFPPSFTGSACAYVYKLVASTSKVVRRAVKPQTPGEEAGPSGLGADQSPRVREVEKCSASFPLTFWSSQQHQQQLLQLQGGESSQSPQQHHHHQHHQQQQQPEAGNKVGGEGEAGKAEGGGDGAGDTPPPAFALRASEIDEKSAAGSALSPLKKRDSRPSNNYLRPQGSPDASPSPSLMPEFMKLRRRSVSSTIDDQVEVPENRRREREKEEGRK